MIIPIKNLPPLPPDIVHKVITWLLFGVVVILIGLNWGQLRQKEQNNVTSTRELLLRLDSLQTLHEESLRQRDLLAVRIDSLDNVSHNLSLINKKYALELKSIKGRYNNLPQDSLGKLMDARAGKNN